MKKSRFTEGRRCLAADVPEPSAAQGDHRGPRHGVHLEIAELDFIRPGKPTENAFIESFDGRLRDECLNVNEFVSIEDARQRIEIWRQDYNHHRPHSSLGHLTPNEFAMQGQETALETAKL